MVDDVVSGSSVPLVLPGAARAALARSIRLVCQQRRDLSVEQLARESGVPVNRLRKLLTSNPDDVRYPRLDEALSIWAVLGPTAATASLDLIGLRAEDAEQSTAESLAHTVAGLVGDLAVIAECAADGCIQTHEADRAERAAHGLIAGALAFFRTRRRRH